MYATATLREQPQRLALTVAGVALCVILMLFLLAVYRGVAVGSIAYVASSDADVWVLQRHAANILRSHGASIELGNNPEGGARVDIAFSRS